MSVTDAMQGLSLIGWRRGARGAISFQARNPATGVLLEPVFFAATPADVERAAALAEQAAPAYAALDGQARGAFLREIARRLEGLAETLAAVVPAETGLAEARVRSELRRTTDQLRLFAAVVEEGSWVDARIDSALPDRLPQPRPDLRSMLQALGPVAVFGASNFPLAFSVAGGDTASALAAGCPVVVKAHPAHPATSELVGQAVVDAARVLSLPEGVFSLLFDDGIGVGQALVRHPAIRAVGFTGSLHGGRALMDIAAARAVPIPVYAEMGSVNPVVVLPGALAARAAAIADGLVASLTLGNGQFCTCPGLVLALDGADYASLRARVVERVATVAAAPMLSVGIARAYADGVADMASRSGVVRIGASGERAGDADGVCSGAPVVFETTGAVLRERPEIAHEVFGPATLLVRCASADELLAIVARLDGQLTATVHAQAQELSAWPRLVPLLARKAGRVLFGGYPTGVEVSHAMVHGGPYPAASDARTTSVGSAAMLRFARPVCFQGWPDELLPPALQRANPHRLVRMMDGRVENSD
ncbi:MAG: aldehyde dehydrogenase (NADP(+)) [Rhodocyclales bacterium]|nr:aldehyde dehydrogenase (NADP(+)) [Rhodocyclales bacterium]